MEEYIDQHTNASYSWATVPTYPAPASRDDASVASGATHRSNVESMGDRLREMARGHAAQVANMVNEMAVGVGIHTQNAGISQHVMQNTQNACIFPEL